MQQTIKHLRFGREHEELIDGLTPMGQRGVEQNGTEIQIDKQQPG